MKKIYLSVILFLIVLSCTAQIPVLYYDFDNNTTRSTFENLVEQYVNTGSGALTKVGGGSISSVNGSGQADGGLATGKAISTNTWTTSTTNPGTAVTKYYQFTVNTTGLAGLQLFLQAQSSGGSNDRIGVLYSINGSTFFASSTAPQALSSSWDGTALYFAIPSTADNQSTVTIRVYGYGFSSTSNTLDIDNLGVMATSQTSGTKTMLDMVNLGKSITAGGTLNYNWGDFTVTGTGTVCTFPNDMVFTGTLTVNANSTLDLGDNIMSGSGSFTLNASGILKIGNLLGISSSGATGNIQVTGTRTFNSDADYQYTGTVAQVTGNGLPASLTGTITINDVLGVTLSRATTFASGSQLVLTSGAFIGTTLLTINSGATITRSAGSLTATLGATAGTIVYTGSSKTVGSELLSSISNVNVNLTAGQILTLSGNNTITGSLTLTGGTLDIGTNTQNITGSIVRNGTSQTGYIDADNGTIVLNGSSAQSIAANTFATTVKNLTINNSSGVTVNSNNTVTGALTLTSGNLSLNGNTLTLSGTVTGSGKLTGSATSGVIVSSTSASFGTLNFDQTTDGTTNSLDSLTVSGTGGTTILGTKLNIYNNLNVSAGTLNLNAQNMVLKSSSAITASVSQVTGTLSGATNVTVERYIPNDGRKYRIITPGVTTTSSIKANWMEGGMNTSVGTNSNPKPGYGTQITGSGGNTNGFDATGTNSASLFTYNATTQGWVAVTNTNGVLIANQPYLIFIRGDRSVDMTSQATTLPSTATILRATGTLLTGDYTSAALVGNSSFNLVGNPFSGAVDWSAIATDASNSGKFQNTYTFWDPKMGTRGSYVTIDNSGSKSNGSSNATTSIQTGMGFFVQSKSGVSNPTLSVKQSQKSSGSGKNGDDVFRTASQMEQLSTSLYFYDANNTRVNADGVLSVFDNSFSKAVDDDDAVQIANWDEDIAIMRNGSALSIEKRPEITTNDTLFISVARLKVQQYEWQFDPTNLATTGLEATLVDNFTNTQQPIRLDQPTYIDFNVTSNPASSAAGRFYVSFRAAQALPINLLSFTGKRVSADNELTWSAAGEVNFDHFEVEYSADQSSFAKLTAIPGKGTSGGTASYTYVHKNIATPNNYYRLKMINTDATFTYSNIVFLKGSDVDAIVYHVYPNPAIGGKFNIDFADQSLKQIDIYDFMGRKVKSAETTSNHFTVEKLISGIYTVDIMDSEGLLLHSEKVLVK